MKRQKRQKQAPGETPCGRCRHYIDFKLTDTDTVKTCELFRCIHQDRREETT